MAKLYARPGSPAAQKVLVAAQFGGVKGVSVVTDASAAQLKGKAPADRMPLLETEKGFLFESNAIARYLVAGNKALLGSDAFQSAQIDAWVDFAVQEIEVPSTVVTYPIIGWAENIPDVIAHGMKDLKAALAVVENHLRLETYLVGRAITLADIACASALVLPFKLVLDAKVRKDIPCVTRWFETVVNHPNFIAVVGPVTLCAKAAAPSAPAKTAAAAPAAAAPAKAEKPAKASKKDADEDDGMGDEEADPAAKKKHPLELLPPSKMVMDEWKRTYSNAEWKEDGNRDYFKAMPWFFANLDKDGYSVYRQSYLYNEENKVDFQVSNLVSGFMQRCDEVRKFAFGNMNIIGDGKEMKIVGMWLLRGPDTKALLDANPDAEYYNWEKLNDKLDDPAIQKEISEMWCAEEQVYGMKILDSKLFK